MNIFTAALDKAIAEIDWNYVKAECGDVDKDIFAQTYLEYEGDLEYTIEEYKHFGKWWELEGSDL